MDGYRTVGRPQEGVNLLRAYLAEASSIDLIEVVFKAVIELEGVEAANQLVVDELRRKPTLLGLDKLLEARLMDAPPESAGGTVGGEESGAWLHAETGALPMQPLRLQGAPVLLAMPWLQPVGNLSAAPHRRTECDELTMSQPTATHRRTAKSGRNIWPRQRRLRAMPSAGGGRRHARPLLVRRSQPHLA